MPLQKLMEATCTKNGCTGITALHLAAAHDDAGLMKYLVEELAASLEPAKCQSDILREIKDGKVSVY